MNRSSSRTLFVYLNVDSLPTLKGDVESAVVNDEEEARKRASNAVGFKYVIVFRLVNSPLDGTYVRLPSDQKMGFMNSMLDYLKRSGFEVGAYSDTEDSPFYREIRTDAYRPKKSNTKIYEIVAPSIDPLKVCHSFLEKHLGEKR